VVTLKIPVLLHVTLVWQVDAGVPKDCTTFRTVLFWVITKRVMVISYRRFGTYWSPLQESGILKSDLGQNVLVSSKFPWARERISI
jgi:hypothetical protein